MNLTSFAPVFVLLGSLSLACGSSPTSSPAPAQAPEPDAGTSLASSSQPTVMGGGCAEVNASTQICSEITSCPGVTIDRATFSECGYLVHGDAIDPECLCAGSLCPMGAPQTCADMQAILNGTTTAQVCAQFVSGKCTNEGAIGGADPDCDLCKANCNGNASCIANCGC
jgi:hypothetical protein